MAENNNIHSGHRGRMLEKFSKNGISAFNEHEMLEVLLFFMFARVNTNPIAHNLINAFGSLKNVLSAPVGELKKIDGIGEKSARQLRFFGELVNYINQAQAAVNGGFSSTQDIIEFCVNYFKDKIGEFLSLLLLDEKSANLHVHHIMSGISGKPQNIAIDYREAVKQIVNYDCRKVIIAQKRTNGNADLSDDDMKVTRDIDEVLRVIDVGIVDHVIICNGNTASMRSSGLLNGLWAN